MDKEIWKDIPEYEGLYQASTLGKVKSLEKMHWNRFQYFAQKERILKPRYDKKGYVVYALFKDGKRKDIKGHRIIAITFLKNESNKPQINHINGIKDDNRVCNLEWCTNQENQIHAFKNGLNKKRYGKENPYSKSVLQYDLNNNFIKEYASMADAARELNIKNYSHICSCCRNKRNKAYGYTWKYKEI